MRILNTKVDREVNLIFDNQSWINIWEWTYSTNIEVGVLGLCHRQLAEDGTLSFYITETYLPKQIANGAHWEVDPAEHGKQIVQRIRELGPSAVNKAKFHYHSHNKMGTSPSSGGEYGDMNVRASHTKDFEHGNPDHYFVFCIGNHAHNLSIEIYDFQTGYVYNESDVNVYIEERLWESFAEDFDKANTYTQPTPMIPSYISGYKPLTTFTYPPIKPDEPDDLDDYDEDIVDDDPRDNLGRIIRAVENNSIKTDN